MSAAHVFATCLMLAAQTYSVPPAVLLGIYKAEGGKVGQEVRNTNGSYDLGPMQINTIWLPELAKKWNVSQAQARKWVRDDACTNVGVAAWIMNGHLRETKSLSQAIAHYNSRTPNIGTKYRSRVLSLMNTNGLIRRDR